MFVKITVVAVVLALASGAKYDINSVIIGDMFYFHEATVARSRAQALQYCRDQGGQLAKITGKPLYDMLRNDIPTVGGYWIDGIDKTTADRFEADEQCTKGGLDFTGIPVANIALPASTCLSLQKGTTAALTKIQAVGCTSSLRGVVCEINLKGCS